MFKALCDRIEWARGVVNFVTDELFVLADWRLSCGEIDAGSVRAKGTLLRDIWIETDQYNPVIETRSAALPILLISSAQFYLRRCCETLLVIGQRIFDEGSKPKDPETLDSRREFMAIFQGPVPVHTFYKSILRAFEADIDESYERASIDQGQRNSIEREMLTSMRIPDFLVPAVSRLLGTRVQQFRGENIDEAELYFLDIYRLGLLNDAKSVQWNRQHLLDGIQQSLLDQNTELRQCVRCGAITDNQSPNHRVNPYLFQIQRTCYCGGWWAVVDNADQRSRDDLDQ